MRKSLCLAMLSCLTLIWMAGAAPLESGSAVKLVGTTFAANPVLGGGVINDDVVPLNAGTEDLESFQGTIQLRVVESKVDKRLVFNWRIKNKSPNPNIELVGITIRSTNLEPSNGQPTFHVNDLDAEWRKDGLGDVPPESVQHSDSGEITFIWMGNPVPAGKETKFFHLVTTATKFAKKGALLSVTARNKKTGAILTSATNQEVQVPAPIY